MATGFSSTEKLGRRRNSGPAVLMSLTKMKNNWSKKFSFVGDVQIEDDEEENGEAMVCKVAK